MKSPRRDSQHTEAITTIGEFSCDHAGLFNCQKA